MEQLEKAKEAVKCLSGDINATQTFVGYVMTECLISIAISLDEKNKAEEKVRNECRADTAKMIKLMEGGLEIQKKKIDPPNPTCYYCGKEITGSSWYKREDQTVYHTACHYEKKSRVDSTSPPLTRHNTPHGKSLQG